VPHGTEIPGKYGIEVRGGLRNAYLETDGGQPTLWPQIPDPSPLPPHPNMSIRIENVWFTGGAAYRKNIGTCAPGTFVSVGDQLKVEPGNMVGPTQQGVQALIDQDPTAFWDPECNCLNSPLGVSSPRLVRISFFDPRYPVVSGRKQIVVGNVAGFFLEGLTSEGDVIGRYTLVPSRGGTPNAVCSLLKAVQLVQ